MRMVVSLVFWSYIGLTCALLFNGALVIWLLTFFWDKRRFWLHRYSCAWAYHYAKLWPNARVRWEGRDKLDDRPVVYVCNHQSLADILILFGMFRHFKWVSKDSIFKVPFIGWNMRLNRYVGLKRGDRDSVKKMMKACHEHLAEGSAVFLFPEGTRSKDGELRAFKSGAFSIAAKAGVPIVPLVLDGTGTILPKAGWVMDLTRVEAIVKVLDPIHPDEVDGDVDALTARTREAIQAGLDELRGRAPVASA